MYVMLEALGRNKQLLFIYILETVFGQLGGIDSAPAANLAVDQIRAFLWDVHTRIEDCLQVAIADGAAIQQLIREIETLTPAPADKTDVGDVKRIFGEVQEFMHDVSTLLKSSKKEIAAAAPRKDGLQQLGFLKPGELLFGDAMKSGKGQEQPQLGPLQKHAFVIKTAVLALLLGIGLRLSTGMSLLLKIGLWAYLTPVFLTRLTPVVLTCLTPVFLTLTCLTQAFFTPVFVRNIRKELHSCHAQDVPRRLSRRGLQGLSETADGKAPKLYQLDTQIKCLWN